MKHLILISTNGTVWDISLNENKSPSKRKLFELPNSCEYHGYSDDKGILYFISGRLGTVKKVVKFHPSFGHKRDDKSINYRCDLEDITKGCSHSCFTQSLQLGNNFWMYGQTVIRIEDIYYGNFYSKLKYRNNMSYFIKGPL